MPFCSGGEKMRNASGVKMSDNEKKKVNKNTYDIFSIKRVTRKFLEVSRFSGAKQRQKNVQKKCAARAKTYCFFVVVVVFFLHLSRCLRHLALHDFMLCLSKL